ncbi:MAG: hypothetical protein LDL44_03190 [Caenispirillum sp.]|nr:hypothetical protein [Caenispirillum sp.]
MADPIACACPICRVVDHASSVSAESTGTDIPMDTIGLLLSAVIKVGGRAGMTDDQVAAMLQKARGKVLAVRPIELLNSEARSPAAPAAPDLVH